MTKLSQTMLVALGIVILVGTVTWLALGGLDTLRDSGERESTPRGRPAAEPPTTAGTDGRGTVLTGRETPGATGEPGGPGGSVAAGLREPSGPDLSNPATVLAQLHDLLAEDNIRWDWVAELLGVLKGPLDATTRKALEHELVEGSAAGAIQAYQRVQDGTVVPSLLRLLDDPASDPHDRANILFALSRIPGGDAGEVVKGIEARLSGDPKQDAPYYQAIARRGGTEAVRALIEALTRVADPTSMPPELWQELDLSNDPGAAEYLAYSLRDTSRPPEVLRRIVEMAGRAGAGPAVDALIALTAPGQPDGVRRQAFDSLGKIGSAKAIETLLATAQAGADYASVASHGISEIASAPPESRAKLLELATATKDEFLRENVITALGNLRMEAAVPALQGFATDGNNLVRRAAVEALGKMGASATPALPTLGKAYSGGDDGMRCQVAVALADIGTPDAKNLLRQLQVIEATPQVKKAVTAALRSFERPPR